MSDRPEVRELMRYLAGPNWGTAGASLHLNGAIPARVSFNATDCFDRGDSLQGNAVRVRLCQEARDALATGQWRFDASDLLPGAVGVVAADGARGAFAAGMARYMAQGPASLDSVLAQIDAAWPQQK